MSAEVSETKGHKCFCWQLNSGRIGRSKKTTLTLDGASFTCQLKVSPKKTSNSKWHDNLRFLVDTAILCFFFGSSLLFIPDFYN